MYRSQYDTDVTMYSPAGRLHQVEYAMEAVKQGSATVGARSATHAVIVSLKRTASDLASYQARLLLFLFLFASLALSSNLRALLSASLLCLSCANSCPTVHLRS
jgi:hypothetical protein